MPVTNCGLWLTPSVIRHRAQSPRELCQLPWTVLLLAAFPGTPRLGAILARAQALLALRQGPCDALLLAACKAELLLLAVDTAKTMLLLGC